MADIENRIEALEAKMDDILKMLTAFNIDKQLLVHREGKIKSGVGCKVAFNSDGLIVGDQPLTPTDIPNLPISKITGIEDAMKRMATVDQVSQLSKKVDSSFTHTKTVKTGTKVNVDSHGFVTDVSDLLEDDIPTLAIEKIKGLRETLDELKISKSSAGESNTYSTKPGIGCKIEYDNHGRVVRSNPLQEEDIPHTILTRLNELESKISTKASASDVERIAGELSKKADKITSTPGIYNRVQVNANGQVVAGRMLTAEDIPDIPVEKITNLESILAGTASQDSFIDLANNVGLIESRVTNVENGSVQNPVPNNRGMVNQEIEDLHMAIDELSNRIDRVISDTSIDEEINKIKSGISELSARISSLEK